MKKVLLILVGLVAVLIISTAIFIASFDVDKYRADIVDILGKQTGRTVTLGGPIKLGFSMAGLTLSIKDAAISNPSWAARANMAGIGEFDLGVAFMPLLAHELEVTHIKIANADIQLESGPNNQNNWTFQPAAGTATPKPATATPTGKPAIASPQTSSSGKVAISLEKVSITDSQLSMRAANGAMTAIKVANIDFSMTGSGLTLDLKGDYNGAPVTVTVDAKTGNVMGNSDFPFDFEATYGQLQAKASGTANLAAKKANVTSYSLASGKTELQGKLQANWSAQPRLQGTLSAGTINLADLTMPASNQPQGTTSPAPAQQITGKRYVLSEATLNLSGLKAADAAIDFSIGQFPVGETALTQISGKLNLAGGQLDLPFKAKLGASDLNGKIDVNGASATPQLTVNFSAPSIELQDVFKAAKLPAFIADTANVQISIAGAGSSIHGIASTANGLINITGGAGKIDSEIAGMVGQALAALFTGGGNSSGLNCVAARFIINNGIVKDNGILVDTSPTTLQGKGGFNLSNETIDLTLKAKTKIANVGGLLPPVHVGGTFLNPGYSADAGAVVQNVVGMLTSGSVASDVPDVKGAPAGQNACLYTLDHPAASSSNAPLIPANAAADQVKNMGNQLIKGIFGH